MPIKTSSCKNKARILQKKVASIITEAFELPEGDCISRPMGSPGVDILMSDLARKTFCLSIECKKTKKHPSMSELRQAQANTIKGTYPAICWSPHGTSEILITLKLKDLVKAWKI